MTDVLDALLEAHVQHELARFRGDAMPALLKPNLTALFGWLGEVTLDQVATRGQILDVIERCVIEPPISGGVTELAGEMSRVVLSSQVAATTRLDDLLHDDLYEEFAAKAAALEGVRRALVTLLAQSEAFGSLSARLFSRALSGLVLRFFGEGAAGALLGRLFPGLERRFVDLLAELLERLRAPREREALLLDALDPEWLRSVADDLWCALARKPLAELFASISDQDLEDFVVLGREFWVAYRELGFFRRLMEELVDHFFDKYGPQTLLSLIDDMGVSESMVAIELTSVLTPLFAQAAEDGFLEQLVRLQLTPFYRSGAARTIVGQ